MTTWTHTIDGSELDQRAMDRLYDEGRAEPDNRGAEPMMVVYWTEDEPEFYIRKASAEEIDLMAAPKTPNPGPGADARRRIGDKTAAARLYRSGWYLVPPEYADAVRAIVATSSANEDWADAEWKPDRDTVWCEAHGGLASPHFERDDCKYPHFTDARTRARVNAAARAQHS